MPCLELVLPTALTLFQRAGVFAFTAIAYLLYFKDGLFSFQIPRRPKHLESGQSLFL